MYDLLIHNGWVVTVNSRWDVITDGLIAISGEVIADVRPKLPGVPLPEARKTLDAKGGIVLPGLVNAHTHLPMSIFRGLADDLPLQTWLQDHIFPAEASHIKPDTVHWGTLLACAEMLLAGVTTCCDGYFLEDAVAEAVAMSGMRAVLGHGVIDFPAPGVPDPAANVQVAHRYVQRWQDRSTLIRPSLFCHAPYTCSDQTLAQAKAAAAKESVLFQLHIAETREEARIAQGKAATESTVERLERLGVLDTDTLLVHGVWLTPDEIQHIAERGCGMVHCPESNMKLAAGIAPLPLFLQAGIAVGLGTDGCASNNDLDLMREMDTAAKLHKVASGDPTAMPAAQVLALATREGAKAIGLGESIGTIEKGKQADLIILNSAHPTMCPIYNPVSQTVYAGSGEVVHHTLVAGKPLVRDGTLVDTDIIEIMRRVQAIGHTVRATQESPPEARSGKGSPP